MRVKGGGSGGGGGETCEVSASSAAVYVGKVLSADAVSLSAPRPLLRLALPPRLLHVLPRELMDHFFSADFLCSAKGRVTFILVHSGEADEGKERISCKGHTNSAPAVLNESQKYE